MAVTSVVYSRFLASLANNEINFNTHVFKAMIVGSSYVPNQTAHQYKSSVTGEIVGSGYTAGGQTVSGVSATVSGKILTITAGNLSWPMVTFMAAKYIVVYDDYGPTQASKPLVCYINFGANLSASSQSFYYNWPSGKMIELAVP